MNRVLVIGANDVATATAVRLFRCGFPVCLVSLSTPFDIFHFRNYSSVFPMGSKVVNGIKALTFADFIFNNSEVNHFSLEDFLNFSLMNRQIPVLGEKDFKQINPGLFTICVVADFELYKSLTFRFSDCTFISCMEKNEDLVADYFVHKAGCLTGIVDYPFLDYPEVNEVPTFTSQLAEEEGLFIAEKLPGDTVKINEKIGTHDDKTLLAKQSGYITGLVRSGIFVPKNQELVRIEPQQPQDIKFLPFESFAIAGGVLEAIMYHNDQNSNRNS